MAGTVTARSLFDPSILQQAVIDCLVDRTTRALNISDAPALVVATGLAMRRFDA